MKLKQVYSGLNYIDRESYFIRLKNNHNAFLHFEGNNPSNSKEEVLYRFKEGAVGAAVWKRKNGERFLKESGLTKRGAELVNVKEVLKNDGTLN